ncbi:hypothetical protein [Roseicella frigidaeris]|uniref:hypothetical protein n=1 Tax=Roseicella frigidaeris TaxID=2230885 RepID=UPI001401BE3B|nr:hypothetical protein [Roseicella frigidaeris]
MTLHWAHVTASYALVLGGFLALGLAATLRLRAARRRLATLDPRARRATGQASAGAPA